jgi:ABC-type lipoprotein release transport system permease subunit
MKHFKKTAKQSLIGGSMASTSTTLKKTNSLLMLPTLIKLAGWRIKNMWRFLFICWLGMLAMVVLVCAVPLFSRVALSAGLRNLGTTSARSFPDIQVIVYTKRPTTDLAKQIQQAIDRQLQQGDLKTYLHQPPTWYVDRTPDLTVLSPAQNKDTTLMTAGLPPDQMTKTLILKQGRFPRATSDGTLEVVLAQSAATAMGVQIGSEIQTRITDAANAPTWSLRVVGIAENKIPIHGPEGGVSISDYNVSGGGSSSFNIVAARDPLLAQWADVPENLISPRVPRQAVDFSLSWNYPFDYSRLDATDLQTVASQALQLGSQVSNQLMNVSGVEGSYISGYPTWGLNTYQDKVVVLQVAITILLALILALVLFLVSMQSDLLIERQATVIATLRSRGATLRNVFSTFLLQAIILSIASLLAGPILALLLVQQISRFLLTVENQRTLNVLTVNPAQAIQGVLWYAVAAILVALLVMIVAINRAAKIDIVTLRRESSRNKRHPFWRRIYLDWVFMILMLGGYGAYTYLQNVLTASQSTGDPQTQLLLNTLGFIATPLFVVAALMLFLRIFPLILRLMSGLVARKRSASAVLALEQMARQPRPASRLIIILALAITSAMFLLTLMATKYQYTTEQTRFYVGASFSGNIPATDSTKSWGDLQATYSKLKGVTTVTLGQLSTAPLSVYANNTPGIPLIANIMAVDAATYGKTTTWCSGCSTESISELADQLVQHRKDAHNNNLVYTIIDDAMAQRLSLKAGDRFKLPVSEDNTELRAINFVVLATVKNIPGFYDSPNSPYSYLGMLTDFESYNTVYAKQNNNKTIQPNYIWLSASNDAATQQNIHKALPDVKDLRDLTRVEQENPIYLNIMGILGIGVATALVLALVGTLLASWLSASSRQTSFAILRALGMAPPQVGAVLLWEQGFIYLLALALGIGLGMMTTVFVVPTISFIGQASPGSVVDNRIVGVPAFQATLPMLQFGLMLATIVLICIVALILMARIVSRPGISQRLRLNED